MNRKTRFIKIYTAERFTQQYFFVLSVKQDQYRKIKLLLQKLQPSASGFLHMERPVLLRDDLMADLDLKALVSVSIRHPACPQKSCKRQTDQS